MKTLLTSLIVLFLGFKPAGAAVITEFVSSSAYTIPGTYEDGLADRGMFRIRFSVTAVDEDIFIPKSGINLQLFNSSTGQPVTIGFDTLLTGLTVNSSDGFYRIVEGSTENFMATGFAQVREHGAFEARLMSHDWNTVANLDNVSTQDLDHEEFRTNTLALHGVPEPSSALFAFLGFFGLLIRRR